MPLGRKRLGTEDIMEISFSKKLKQSDESISSMDDLDMSRVADEE